ncbi:hypothetical protein T4E_11741 [Trichinella pseudospiralis]|uniref:Uncharacterized protein n=1 Tax=Trichinella pseudospiralis TaxID=6337 RepID=A0A0V0XND3_TRIPS|nr:hypothetical protein T4E_11741 [Trichinella pseudospiralis]
MVYCRHECRIHDFAMKCIFDQHCNVNNFFLLTRRFRRSIQQETGGKRPTCFVDDAALKPGERVEFLNCQQIHALCVH